MTPVLFRTPESEGRKSCVRLRTRGATVQQGDSPDPFPVQTLLSRAADRGHMGRGHPGPLHLSGARIGFSSGPPLSRTPVPKKGLRVNENVLN